MQARAISQPGTVAGNGYRVTVNLAQDQSLLGTEVGALVLFWREVGLLMFIV
jgi:hypothetical protein